MGSSRTLSLPYKKKVKMCEKEEEGKGGSFSALCTYVRRRISEIDGGAGVSRIWTKKRRGERRKEMTLLPSPTKPSSAVRRKTNPCYESLGGREDDGWRKEKIVRRAKEERRMRFTSSISRFEIFLNTNVRRPSTLFYLFYFSAKKEWSLRFLW